MKPLISLIQQRIDRTSTMLLYLSLTVIYFWFGGMKFTQPEAEAIEGLVKNSFLIGWMYDFLSVQGFSNMLGVIEVSIGLLIISGRIFHPLLSAIGGALSMGLFFTTLSFLVSTPGIWIEEIGGFPAITVLPGQFLLKDFGLFALSLFIVNNSLRNYETLWQKKEAA